MMRALRTRVELYLAHLLEKGKVGGANTLMAVSFLKGIQL